ncbi:MAG TPA: TonB-dependent receptor [Bacteroidales bacterium]|nr:TonB-dependent receptor [Bacteroidales bacterium]
MLIVIPTFAFNLFTLWTLQTLQTLQTKKMKKYTLYILLIFATNFSFSQNGKIKGKISDEATNEPIAFANVVIKGTNIGTTSDLDGNFIITGLNQSYIQLQASFIGYETGISQDVFVSNVKTEFIEIKLKNSQLTISEVVVKANPFQKKEEAPIAMQKIGIKEIESNPGSNRDISRVIQSFPGVGSTPAFRNDIIIRGGGPSENRFYLDDVEIPVLNHFSTQGASGGPVGIINADFISSVNFYAGSFPASKNNSLSGVFEFYQKEGNKEKLKFRGSIGASETSATFDGPIGKKTSYVFSVRRSYLQFLFQAIGLPFLPTFNDYQFKLKTRINDKNEISVISLGSLDNLTLNTGIKNPTESQQYQLSQIPVNNQWSYTFGVVYKHFSKNGYQTLVLSRNMLNNVFYKYPDNDETRAKIFDYKSVEQENKIRFENTSRLNGYKISYGLSSEFANYFNETKQMVYFNNISQEFKYKSDLNLMKYGVFGQVSKAVMDNRLSMSFGLRSDASNFSSSTNNLLEQISPRLSASFSITEKLSLNAGVGRFYQLPAYTTLGYRDINNVLVNQNVKYIGADHFNLGFEEKYNENVIFSVEGFYKNYFQYPIDLFSGSSLANSGAGYSSVAGATAVNSSGKGKAVGFEVLNRIKTNTFTFIASYTFVRSLFTDVNGKEVPSSWDSKHLLTITASKEFKKGISFGLKWRFVGGLPYTPYDLETSAYVAAWDVKGEPYLDFSKLNAERFKSFHQLDLRFDKKYFFKKWNLMFYIDIQNAYNFQNKTQDYIIREMNADGTYKTTDGGTKYVLKSIENVSGTVLPTLGIMIEF